MPARDVPYSLPEAEQEHLDMRLVVVGCPTVEADIVRVDLDRWTLRGWKDVMGEGGVLGACCCLLLLLLEGTTGEVSGRGVAHGPMQRQQKDTCRWKGVGRLRRSRVENGRSDFLFVF